MLSIRGQFIFSGIFFFIGAVSIMLPLVWGGSGIYAVLGTFWLLLGAGWLVVALQERHHRKQRGHASALPVPAPEVVTLVEQGQNIRAIKLYRTLNPGISLRDAKDAVDSLQL